MKLDTATVANIARRAGFYGDELVTVTALALASSGGNTHYRHVVGLAGTGDWRGLWAIDVDRYPDYADVDLFDPDTAARAVKLLTEQAGGFTWSDQYRAGTHTHALGHVAGKTSEAMHTQTSSAPVTYHAAQLRSDAIMLQRNIRRAALASRPTREVPPWLRHTPLPRNVPSQ